jgi:phage terminase large subunit-like protein
MTRWRSCVISPAGFPEPRVRAVPPGGGERAAAAIGVAALAGVELDGWQRMVLGACLGRQGGRWSAFECSVVVPRQNGKSLLLAFRELAGVLCFGERLVIHSAHEWRTVSEQFAQTLDLVEGSPLRRYLVRVRRTGGEESMTFANGGRIRFMNRSRESARGFSADLVVLDEAHALTAEQAAALLPVPSSRPDPQLWYAAAGPAPGAWQLSRLRQRVMNGDTARLAWLEWSADPLADTEDRAVWLAANPAAAVGRLAVERMAEERASLGFDGFRAERLACAPWPSELDNAYGLFTPDDLRDLFGRSA